MESLPQRWQCSSASYSQRPAARMILTVRPRTEHGFLHLRSALCQSASTASSNIAATAADVQVPPYAIYAPKPSVAVPPVALKLPKPINCLFSVHCHPDYQSIKGECEQWALSFFDSASQAGIRETYLHGLYPLLLTSFYPTTLTRERMVLLINLVTWLFMLDDTIDESDGKTAAEVAQAFITVLTSSSPGISTARPLQYKTSNGCIKRFTERFRVEVWEPMCRGMSPSLHGRLVGEMLRSIEAMKKMWWLRQQGVVAGSSHVCANVEEMMALRIFDGFAWPAVLLVEYALGIELPGTGAREMPDIVGTRLYKMTEIAADHIILVNDMFSSGKELANMDAQSLIGCLASQKGGRSRPVELLNRVEAMQQVLGETWEMIQEKERVSSELLQQIRNVAQKDKPGHAQCVIYAEALCNLMAGNIYWSCRTWRYNGPHPIPWNTTPSYITISSTAFRALNVLASPPN